VTTSPQQRARVRLVAAACLLAATALGLATGWGSPAWWAVPVLALAVAASELAVVHLQIGRQRWTFSLIEAVLGAALVFHGGAWTGAGVAAGVAVSQAVRRQPRLKLEFNVAMFAAAAGAAQACAALAGGGMPGAVCGLGVFWLANHLLVAAVLALTTRRPLRELLVSSVLLSAVHTAGNASIGLLAAHLVREAPFGLFGLLVPLALLWTSYDQQTHRSGEALLFAELARGQERASDRSTDVSARVVLTAAARLFGGADVEMVLLAPEGPVRYAGDEDGTPRRLRVDPEAFDEPWVLRALGAGEVTTGTEDGRPWCSAVLGEPEAPLAVLVARRPAGSRSFGRAEVRLAQVLVRQAEAWLSASELSARHRAVSEQAAAAGGAARALGELGAQTAPALTVLRESAGRLARLAESAAEVDDIVEELHLVERAVASLLGALALAADPDLLVGPAAGAVPAPRPAADWTTTGVLT